MLSQCPIEFAPQPSIWFEHDYTSLSRSGNLFRLVISQISCDQFFTGLNKVAENFRP
jgi:hypothetical protein